jgi:phospholipid/cholesterol/gamma-HCH transport system substrate-binding protein
MNNKVNYTFVGFIVLMGIAFIMGLSYWMLKPSADNDIKKYTILFDESVLGLNIDAPVKYRGISVGKVSAMKINPTNTEQVSVTVSILKSTPIKADTVAKLTSQGITGLSYINLNLGSHNAECLKAKEGEKYPVIKTVPSFLKNLENSFGDVSTHLTSTLVGTEELLGANNQREVALLLKRSASVMQKVDLLLNDETIAHIQSTTKNLDEFTAKLNNLMPDINKFLIDTKKWEESTSQSFDSIMVSYLGLDKSMYKIQDAFQKGEVDFKELKSDLIPTMNATLLGIQDLMIKLDEALEGYRESPSDLLFKRREIKKAPGEE